MKCIAMPSILVILQFLFACTFFTSKVSEDKTAPHVIDQTAELPEAVTVNETAKVTWNIPGSSVKYVYLGMGTFDSWHGECQKLGSNMRPLTLDVNFSKSVAKELLSAAEGAVFDSEEVSGSTIIEGRMIAYKLANLADEPCESYPRAKDGGKLPAFFVPVTAVQRGELRESDLIRRAYTCKLASRMSFPIPIVCAGQ